ncbi:MAG: glycine cleavage system aminomethyltransferase GcvT [Verrucomicrobiota bacterium]
MKESPLQSEHERLGGRMVDFAGWSMPVQYAGILKEHEAVRTGVGVFDISHMGEVFVRGERAGEWLNGILTNDLGKLGDGEGQYSLMLNEAGGVIDDLIVYRLGGEEYFLVVNAARAEEDVAWLEERAGEGVEVADRSEAYGAMAIQGPGASALFGVMAEGTGIELPERNGIVRAETGDGEVIVCRTGYTGEDGFEWFCAESATADWFERALAGGAEPCGLGARDTLRLEMGYPLNGSDLMRDRTPVQAGLGFFVDLGKEGGFVGSDVLAAEREAGGFDRLAAIQFDGKGPPPRPHYEVFSGEERIGELTSGTMSPSLGVGIGMAYLPAAHAKVGTEVAVDVRGRRCPAKVVKKPFLKR